MAVSRSCFLSMNIMRQFSFLLSWVLVGALTACASNQVTPTPNTAYPAGYPSPTGSVATAPTPAAGYPAPRDLPTPIGIPITLQTPLSAEATEVRGRGPAGLPITIIDISLGGEVLGAGVIGADGTFAVAVNVPLQIPNLIGVQVNSDVASSYSPDATFLCLNRCRDFPSVGLVYDYGVVTAP